MAQALTAAQLHALAALDSSLVSNAIEQFNVRLRNEGFCDSSIRCLTPALPQICGYAVTVKMRISVPPTVGRSFHDRTDLWQRVLATPAPRIVAIQDIDARPGLGAVIGEIHANIFRALGCAGCITNGAVRNLRPAEGIGFQVFASGASASHAFAHVVSFGEPVELGRLVIKPGDLLHADCNGVVSVPLEIAAQIPAMAQTLTKKREEILRYCGSKDFSVDGLQQMVERLG
jgi:4-hydroxy-4-methyl-2-oxoglutarate aldolase